MTVIKRQQVLLFLAASAAAMAQSSGIGAFGGGVPAVGKPRSVLNTARDATRADAIRKQAGTDEGLRQAFERAAYSLKDSGHGTYRGVNPAQRLTFEFTEGEARLSHPDGSVAFHLTGYGYGDRLQQPASARLFGAANRVEYRRGDLTEWYANGAQGLEQGFTLAHRPGMDRKGEPLVIALGVTGDLLPAQKTDEGSVLFESSQGVVLRYGGLTAMDARGRILPSRLEVRGREIRLIVEDRDDGAGGDNFGNSVSVSGDTAVIGASNKAGSQGAAYVFVRSGGVWSQLPALTASDGAAGDLFGGSVSVSGNTAVIGAPGKTLNSNAGQGAAYVFVLSGGVWSQVQKLTASDGAAGDQFGASVSVSGNTAVIGAPGQNSSQGAAYVFAGSAGIWSQQQELTLGSDGWANDQFGNSVSLSGSTAVIGAWGKNGSQGAAYVFVGSNGAWAQQQELAASDGEVSDRFGYSVSVSGNTVAIGAWGKNGSQGVAYVFVGSNGGWAQQQELAASDGEVSDQFGYSVSVSGDTAVIGALGWQESFGIGAAYGFARSGGVWSQQQELTLSGGLLFDAFGESVSLSGTTAVIGALDRNSHQGQGAAYVFVGPALAANALLVGSTADASSVILTCSSAWTATANDSFLHISAGSASGTGSGVVVFTYDAFTGPGTRTGTLTIAGLTATVTQVGANYIAAGVTTLVSSGLGYPGGVAVDSSGNVYIADTWNNAIKKWSASTQQVTGLSGPVSYPLGVSVDTLGNVYSSDSDNNAIKEWNAATGMSTLVSSGLNIPSGVAVDNSGNVYIADTWNNAIKEWSASTQQVTTLVSLGLYVPSGVAVDSVGNVYIADTFHSAVKEWSASTQQVTALASSGLHSPYGVAVDSSGNVYIADTGDNAIKKWSPSTQQVTTLASSGLLTPSGVAVDSAGNVYIADTYNNAIKEINLAFIGPASLTESLANGSDSLLPVLPATASLTGIFAPTSDSAWLTIGTIANGVISFSFTANTSVPRTAHITVLGQQITVTQNGVSAQTIAFGAPADQLLGSAPLSLTATASSGLPVSFNSQSISVCTVSGTTATLVSVGTCAIQATQAGSTDYAAAPSVSQSFQVSQEGQTITFGALSNQVLGTAPFTVSATASSSLAVDFNSQTTSVCAISDVFVSLVSVGTCTIQATQAGNANYAVAPSVSQSFQVTQGSQTITFAALPSQAFGAVAFTVSANASSSLAIGFNSQTTSVCAISGVSVTLVSVGTCTIQATQAGNPNYAAATSVSQSFQVSQEGQTITFGALSNEAFGTAPFTVSATASSSLAVDFNSQTTSVCAISDMFVTLISVGTCTIQATQAGNANYAAAPSVSQSFQVTQGSQTITFAALSNEAFGTAPFTVNAATLSGLAASFNSQTTGVCTVSGTTVTLVSVGICTIQTTQAGNANYAVAPSANQSFQVTQGSQTITFAALSNEAFGTAPFTVNAATLSGLAVSFNSQTTGVCTVSGTTVTLVSVGICTIQATQAGNSSYAAAPSVSQSFQVSQEGQTITFGALANQPLGTAPFRASATASSVLPVSFTSITPGVCAASGTTVTLVSAGTCTIQATQAGNTNWAAGTPVSESFLVTVSMCDLEQNGSINVADVQLIINEALGVTQAVNDLNRDGVVTVVDIQIEINAALGLGCTAT